MDLNINIDKDNIILLFNKTLLNTIDYIDNLKYIDKTSTFVNTKPLLNSIIEIDKTKPLVLFLLHVYNNDMYRTKIKSGDDTIFNDLPEFIEQLFMLKNNWNKLNTDSKIYIKKTMLLLILLAEKYII